VYGRAGIGSNEETGWADSVYVIGIGIGIGTRL
jgi:hypothetical protein